MRTLNLFISKKVFSWLKGKLRKKQNNSSSNHTFREQLNFPKEYEFTEENTFSVYYG